MQSAQGCLTSALTTQSCQRKPGRKLSWPKPSRHAGCCPEHSDLQHPASCTGRQAGNVSYCKISDDSTGMLMMQCPACRLPSRLAQTTERSTQLWQPPCSQRCAGGPVNFVSACTCCACGLLSAQAATQLLNCMCSAEGAACLCAGPSGRHCSWVMHLLAACSHQHQCLQLLLQHLPLMRTLRLRMLLARSQSPGLSCVNIV